MTIAFAQSSYTFAYQGRLSETNGKPVDGPVALQVTFFRAASGGAPLLTVTEGLGSVPLQEGIFQIELALSPGDYQAVFSEVTDPVYVQITDMTHAPDRPYDRQKVEMIPYAAKVPVDNKTITFDGTGRATLMTSGTPGAGKVLGSDGAGGLTWVAAATGSGQSTNTPSSLVQRDANGGFSTDNILVNPGAPGRQGLIVKGAAAQTANLQEWQDSSGSVLSAVGSDGSLKLKEGGAGTHQLSLKAASGMSANATYVFPAAPDAGKFLSTDASGNLSWAAPSGSASSLTLGSLPFVDSSGNFTEDNAKLFWDNTNKRLGVGTTTPGANLGVSRTSGGTPLVLLNEGTVSPDTALLKIARANNIAAPTPAKAGLYISDHNANYPFYIDDEASHPVFAVKGDGSVGVGTSSPASKLEVKGAIATTVAAKSSAYTLTVSDSVVTADASGGAFTIALPTAASITGRRYTIKKTDASANAVTLDPFMVETIDGGTTYVLSKQNDAVSVVSDGASWFVDTQVGSVTALSAHGSSGDVTTNSSGTNLTFSGSGVNSITATNASGSLALGVNGAASAVQIKSGNTKTSLSVDGDKVAIGTTATPGSELEIRGAGATTATSALNVTNSGGTSSLFVRDDGDVGIGTSSPGARLTVIGEDNTASTPIGEFYSNNKTHSIKIKYAAIHSNAGMDVGMDDTSSTVRFATNTLYFITASTYAGAFDVAHSFGAGTTDPTLGRTFAPSGQVAVTAAGTGALSNSMGVFQAANQIATVAAGDQAGAVDFVFAHNAGRKDVASLTTYATGTGGANGFGGDLTFSTKPDNSATIAERMRIDSAGHVGIGTTTPTAQLEVDAASASNTGLLVKGAASQSGNLQEWRSSTGTLYNAVNADGTVDFGGVRPNLVPSYGYNPKIWITDGGQFPVVIDNNKYITWLGHTGVPSAFLTTDTSDAFSIGTTSNSLPIKLDGSNILLQSSSSGNVGVGTSSPASKLEVKGAIATTVAAKSSAYTLTASDSVVTADASGGAFTIALPTAASITGRRYTVKKTDASANTVTLDPFMVETIDGGTTYVLSKQNDAVSVVSDGASWFIDTKTGSINGSTVVNTSGTGTFSAITSHGSSADIATNGAGTSLTFGNAGLSTVVASDAAGSLGLGVNGATSAILVKAGNAATDINIDGDKVAIGTTATPGSKLEIRGAGSNSTTSSLNVTNAAGVSELFVRDDGFVGINTSSPGGPLEVHYPAQPNGFTRFIYGGLEIFYQDPVLQPSDNARLQISQSVPGGTGGGSGAGIVFNVADGSTLDYAHHGAGIGMPDPGVSNRTLALWTSDGTKLAERMRIDSNGNVGIGTTNPVNPLHIVGGNAIRVTASAGGSFGSIVFGDDASTNSGTRAITGNSAELQIGATLTDLRFMGVGGSNQIESSAADGATSLNLTSRTAHTSGNLLQVYNGGTGTTAKVTVDFAGNVGVGTTTPGSVLDLYSTTNPLIRLTTSSSTAAYLRLASAKSWDVISQSLANGSRMDFTDSTDGVTAMSILPSGKVGIGTTSPSNTLHVVGSLCVKASGNCAGSTGGTIYVTNAVSTGADLAEHMPVAGAALAAGDVVAIEDAQGTGQGAFVRSETAYQVDAVGVVSTAPGVSLGSDTKTSRPVALAGRVPANVTLEGGAISVGDYLVASSTPGKAMRAADLSRGGIIGIALSAYDGTPAATSPQNDGIAHEAGHQVMMFVRPLSVTSAAFAKLAAKDAAKDRQIAELKADNARIQARSDELEAKMDAITAVLCQDHPDAGVCTEAAAVADPKKAP